MRGRVFISYRRDDARGDARSIRDRLARKFGESNVFMDVDSLLAGQRFDHQLDKALADCDVLIAIIGPRWMEGLAEKARDDERDYVRAEIAAALKRDIVVIPVLTGQEGKMPALPRASELPEDIRDLVLYQKHSITHESFSRNIDDLIAAINAVQQSRRKPFPWKPLAAAGAVAAVVLVAALIVFRGEIGGWIGSHRSAEVPAPPVVQPKQAAPEAKKAELSPAEIAERYASSTVAIRFAWRLYQRDSGRPLYHRAVRDTDKGKDARKPVYLRIDGKVLPWLTTDDEEQKNYQVRGAGTGTGFIASADGFILTTRTVGSAWGDGIRPQDYVEADTAFVIGKDDNGKVDGKIVPISELNLPRGNPEAEGEMIFAPRLGGTDENRELPAGTRSAVFGRNETLVVRLPSSGLDLSAELVRRSPDRNVVLLTIATPMLTPVPLATGDELKIGTRVVALAYDRGAGAPTLAEGIVRSGAVDGTDRLRSNIQTSIQVGLGTSGAPVFDPDGKVIGIVSFFTREGGQAATYLLPIRHGRNLLQPQAPR